MELEVGAKVGDRYLVVRPLGQGGAAWVYRATDTRLGCDVALKAASPFGPADGEVFEARVQREAKIGFLLGKAPGIVRCLDWGPLSNKALFMVFDLVEDARPLDLESGPASQRLQRLLTAASRLDLCHAKGIVHRDVKPQNFMVSKDGTIYLSDFGTAKLMTRPGAEAAPEARDDPTLTQMGTLLGTPLYMAPEQFRDPSSVDPRADVFSLGVMLYHALTGQFPYKGANALEIMTNQVLVDSGVLPVPPTPRTIAPEVSDGLERLCLASISLNAADRPPDAATFRDELAQATGQARTRPSARATAVRRGVAGPPSRDQLCAAFGADASGFAPLAQVKAAVHRLGAARARAMLGSAILLLVSDERPVEGKTRYLGRVAIGASRSASSDRVTIGRAPECDLTLDLVTVSKLHLVLARDGPGRWVAMEMGSSNGTRFNGGPLRPEQRQPVVDGDELRVSDHVSLTVATLERLEAAS